jgi:hypothetical protein
VRRALVPAAVALTSLALVVAGCGSSGGGSKAADTTQAQTPAGAAVAPASAALFVAVATQPSSDQWQALQTLAPKVPALDKQLSQLDELLPALGPETDVVAVTAADAKAMHFVGLTQSPDPQHLQTLLAKRNGATAVEDIAGWQVFADQREWIDDFKRARNGGTLDGNADYKAAVEGLPADAVARAYASRAAVATQSSALTGTTGQLARGVAKPGWLSASVQAEQDGFGVEARAESQSQTAQEAYKPELLSAVPADAAFLVDVKGLKTTLSKAKSSTGGTGELGTLTKLIGGELDRIIALFSNETAFYVVPAKPKSHYALVVKVDDEQDAMDAIDTLVSKVGPLLGATPQDVQIDGKPVKKVDLKSAVLYYGASNGRLVVSNWEGAFAEPAQALQDADSFKAAGKDLPEKANAFAYADLPTLLPLLASSKNAKQLNTSALEGLHVARFAITNENGVYVARGFVTVG